MSEVNFHGVMASMKAFGSHMLPDGGVKDRPYKQAKNGWGGHILIIGSGAAYIELPANAAYNASKAATVSLHSSLSAELHAYHKVDNVRASIICPLKIETKMTEGRMLDTHDQVMLPTLTIPRGGRQDRRDARGGQEQDRVHAAGAVRAELQQDAPGLAGEELEHVVGRHGHVLDVC